MRDWPTAKSAMSIISCTSPNPSALILPFSSVTSAPRSSFATRSASPSRRMASPRRGAGTLRHAAAASPPLRQRLAGGGIDRGEQRTRDVLGPAERAAPGAGVDRIDAEPLEDGGDFRVLEYGVHFLRPFLTDWGPRTRRWWPAWPLTTTAEDTSLVPPGA